MSATAAQTSDEAPEIRRLTFDLDVEICVIGGGLAGLSVALEAAQMGASVALLEAKRIGWSASAFNLGNVLPGFAVSPQTVIDRVGRRAASELWRMSQTGAEIVRVRSAPMTGIAMSEGALDVSGSAAGDRALDDAFGLGSEFGIQAQLWSSERLRDVVKSKRYFNALHYSRAFQIDSVAYLQGLVAMARDAGVRIFEETPALTLDVSGARKRVTTPSALLRASHVVLAGNTDLGALFPRLAATLLPVWRFGAITAPLAQLNDAIAFGGAIADSDGIDHFRIVEGRQLMWSNPCTTWQADPKRFASAICQRIARIFPQLGEVTIAETFGGVTGCTVHGMPQIGQLRPGLWVCSGFGWRGLNTTAMAGRVIARGILQADDRWRLFGPFDLIWAGGRTGQAAGYAIEWVVRQRAAIGGTWARRRETAMLRPNMRDARIAATSRRVTALPATALIPTKPITQASYHESLPPSPFLEMPASDPTLEESGSQQSEQESRTSV